MSTYRTHREAYPDQYAHPLCGHRVVTGTGPAQRSGILHRVVSSRFGQMGILVEDHRHAYRMDEITLAAVTPSEREFAVTAIIEWFNNEAMRSLAIKMADKMIATGQLIYAQDVSAGFHLRSGVDLNEVACEIFSAADAN